MPTKISPIAAKLKTIATELYQLSTVLDDYDRPKLRFLRTLDQENEIEDTYGPCKYYSELIPEPALKIGEEINPQTINKIQRRLHQSIKADIKKEEKKLGIDSQKAHELFLVLLKELPDLSDDIIDILTGYAVDQEGLENVKVSKRLVSQLAPVFRVLGDNFSALTFTIPAVYNNQPVRISIEAEQVCEALSRYFARLASKRKPNQLKTL